MGRRNDHSRDQLRALVVEAAEAIVADEGLAGLTARKVAARIGYSPGSLYVIFANLDEIVIEVNARTLGELHQRVRDAMAKPQDPGSTVRALAATYLAFAQQHNHRWRCIFEHRLPADMRLPGWYLERVAAMFARVGEPLARLAPDLDARAVRLAARALWGAVHGVCILGLDEKLDLTQRSGVTDVLDVLVTTYIRGVRCPA